MNDRKPKILIVDNEIEICSLFKDFFDFIGYDSTYETDGEKIIAELGSYEYDLMFVDLKLETVSGIDILKKSKELHPFSEVIVVTGFGSEETVLATLRYGASSYIQKPISFSDIRVQTQEALAKRRFNIMTDSLKKTLRAEDQSLVKHLDTILSLDRLSQFLNLTIDIDMLGDSILHGLADIIPASYYSFFFYDKVNREMVFYSEEPLGKEVVKELGGRIRGGYEKLTNKIVEEDYNVRVSRTSENNGSDDSVNLADLADIHAPILIENTICGVIGVTGEFGGCAGEFEDILILIANRASHVLANATLHRDTKLLALTDGLTGLLNHRAFHDRLVQEFERYKRYGSYLSLIVGGAQDRR